MMGLVLVDTSVWVELFRRGQPALVRLFDADRVLSHPWVLGEVACGTPPAADAGRPGGPAAGSGRKP